MTVAIFGSNQAQTPTLASTVRGTYARPIVFNWLRGLKNDTSFIVRSQKSINIDNKPKDTGHS